MENMWFTDNAFLDFKNKTIIFVDQDNRRCEKSFPARQQWRVCNLIYYLAANKTKTQFTIKELTEAIWGGRGKELKRYKIDDVRHATGALRDLLYDEDDTRRKSFLVSDQDYVYFDPPLDKPPPDDFEPEVSESEQKEETMPEQEPEQPVEVSTKPQEEELEQPDELPPDAHEPEELEQPDELPPDAHEPEELEQPDELPPVDLEPEESGQTDELPLDDLEPEEAEQTEKLPPIDFDPEGSGQLNVDTSKEKTAPQKNEKQSDDSAIPYSLRFMPERESLNIGFTIKIILIGIVGIILYKYLVPLLFDVDDAGLIIRPYVPVYIKVTLILMITVGAVGFFNGGNGQVIESLVLSKMRRTRYRTFRLSKKRLRESDVQRRTRKVRIVQRIIMLSALVLIYALIQKRIDLVTEAYIEIINERSSSSESSAAVSEESASEESTSEEIVLEESISEEITDFNLDKTSLILTTDMSESQYQLGAWINGFHLKLGETADDASKAAWLLLEQDFEWSSSDPTVATVSEEGLVTAIKDGNTTITAFYNGYSAMCDISVKNGMWSEWSGWTTEPITPLDFVEVETRVWDEDTITFDMVSYKTWVDETEEVQYRNYSIGDNYEFYGLSKSRGEICFHLYDVTASYLEHNEIVPPGTKQTDGYLGVNKATVDGYSILGGSVFRQIFFIENTNIIDANKTYYRFREFIETPVIYNND